MTARGEARAGSAAPARALAWPQIRFAVGRVLHSALALALMIGAVLEYVVFRHAYMLADRSTVAITYKAKRLEAGRSDNIIILGPSTALAIDAASLERPAQANFSIYNYALPNLGSSEQYYFVLKRYLQFNRRPDLILLTLPPDSILNRSAEQSDPFIEEIERQRFRRFFGPMFLLTQVAPTTGQWSFVTDAAISMLPSINYRVFIKNGTFAPELDEASDTDVRGSAASIYRRNRQIVSRLEATHGQLIYNGNRIVPPSEIARSLPSPPDLDLTMARSIEKVIRLADASGISTTMIFTPLCCERALDLAQSGTWELLAKLVRRYEENYPRFRFVEVGSRSYEREYFGDPIHLNERGASRFGAELVARLPTILSPRVEGH